MGNEQSQVQQNEEDQQVQQFQPQQQHKKQQNMQQDQSGEQTPQGQDQYSEYDSQGNSIQKPIESQASFRQNPMQASQNNQQQMLSQEQTANFGVVPNSNLNSNQPNIPSFRDQDQYNNDQQLEQQQLEQQQQQQFEQQQQLDQEQLQQMSPEEYQQFMQQQNNPEYQQQLQQQQYNQMGQQNPHLESFQQNEQGEYEDPNANKYSAIDQERKIQIIEEQLYHNSSAQPFTQEKKLSKQQEQELVYNLLQKGKDIEYRQRMLNEKYAAESVQECLFQPSQDVKEFNSKNKGSQQSQVIGVSLAQQQEPRSFQQFLNDQNKFQNKREKGIKEIKNRVEERQLEGFTGKPQLCQKSEAIVQNKLEQNKRMNNATKQPTYKRLYELNDKKKKQKQNDENIKTEKSQQFANKQQSVQLTQKNNQTKDQAANRLYQDFKRRQDKQKEQEQYFSKKLPSQQEDTQVLSQKKNDLCLAKKLLKEFDLGIAELQSEYHKNLQYLDYIQMSELLQFMHFTSKHVRIESANFIKERSLINDLWIILEGQKTDRITGRNLILVMLGIMGIHIDIPTFKPSPEDQHQNQPPVQEFGEIQLEQQQQQPQKQQQQVDSAMPLNRDSDLFDEQQQIQFQNEQAQQQIEQQKYNQFVNEQNDDQLDRSHISTNRQNQMSNSQNTPNQQLLSDYKPVNLEQQQNQAQQQEPQQMQQFYSQRYQELVLGTYDQDRNLYLNEEDIKKIQKHFHVLYLNRLNYVGSKQDKIIQQQSSQKQQFQSQKLHQEGGSQYSVTSQKNEQLAHNYRSKLYELAQQNGQGEQLSNYDLMLAHKDIRERKAHMLREIQEDKEMEECTFAPQTQNYVSPVKEAESANTSYQQKFQGEPISFKNAKKPMTTQSLGAERYLSLYKLAKPRSQLRDKATDEIEYEKNCDECTFNPDLQTTKSPQGQNLHKPKQYNYIKNGDKQVNRLRNAYDVNSSIQKFKSRGYDYYQSSKKQTQGSQMSSQQLKQNSQQFNSQSQQQQQQQFQPQQQTNKFNPGYTFGGQNQQMNNQLQQQQNQDPNEEEQFNQQQYDQEHNNMKQPEHHDEDNNNNDYEYENQNMNENQEQSDSHLQHQNQSGQEEDAPMLFVDVNLSPERIERIVVNKGDDIYEIADQFIQKHELNPSIKNKLVELLNDQIKQFLDMQQEQSMQEGQ